MFSSEISGSVVVIERGRTQWDVKLVLTVVGEWVPFNNFSFCSPAVCDPVPQQTIKVLSKVCRVGGFVPLNNTHGRKLSLWSRHIVDSSLGTDDGCGGGE